MYIAKIVLNKKKFKGTLDFCVIKNIQQDLKEHGFDYQVKDIFKSLSDISNINMHTVASIILHSIVRVEHIDEEVVENDFISSTGELSLYVSIFEYINKLLEKCMPSIDKTKEIDDLFEEEDIEKKDWDFDYMEYLWYSILKRTDDFYKITPKTFFKQMDISKKMNNVKEENVKYI